MLSIFMRRCLGSIATLTGNAPGLGDGKEGPIRRSAEIALRLQVTPKACAAICS